jgi:hypothetical protein
MIMKVRALALALACGLILTLTSASSASTILFDFDTCIPNNILYHSTPLDQTCSGVLGHFSSTTDGQYNGGFSVQNASTTGWVLSLFSGNYLIPNSLSPGRLDVSFSQTMNSISFPFATADFNQNETPTTIQLDMYLNNGLVGSVQAHGTYGNDTMPMGTISFSGADFDRIEIWIPWQPLGTSDFLVDSLAVTPAVPEPTTLGLIGAGCVSVLPFLRKRLGR